jgi:hypothetical protein
MQAPVPHAAAQSFNGALDPALVPFLDLLATLIANRIISATVLVEGRPSPETRPGEPGQRIP